MKNTEDEIANLYEASYARLVGGLRLVAGSPEAAEDAVQEAFIRLLSRYRQVRGYDQPESWVRRVALNIIIDQHRRGRREAITLRRIGSLSKGDALRAEPEADQVFVQVVQQLPAAQRRVVALHYGFDLSVDQIATETGSTKHSVRNLLYRARLTMRERIDTNRQPHEPSRALGDSGPPPPWRSDLDPPQIRAINRRGTP